MNTLTVGYLRELIKDLPDDMHITECDYDESHLSCTEDQIVRDAQFLMFVPHGVDREGNDEFIESIRQANLVETTR
jgi:hypothetical protein